MVCLLDSTSLVQPPYDTGLVGVVKGALDHYGIDTAPAETFVLSGHAFVINIHEELCPSGARLLYRASDKTASAGDKRGFVEQARSLDERCVERIAEIRSR